MNHRISPGRVGGWKRGLPFMMGLGAFLLAPWAQEPPDTNYDESKVPPNHLPDPLVCFDGRRVIDAGKWREIRRPEILRAFATNMSVAGR